MTRELKLALVVGFALVLLVTVLISDHLSGARNTKLDATVPAQPAVVLEQQPSSGPVITIAQGSGGGVRTSMGGDQLSLMPSELDAALVGATPANNGRILSQVGERMGEPLAKDTPGGSTVFPPMVDVMNVSVIPFSQQPNHTPEKLVDDVQDSRLAANVTPTAPVFGSDAGTTLPPITMANTSLPVTVLRSDLPADQVVKQPGQGPNTNDVFATQPTTKTQEERWHTIAQGESLYTIAKKYYGTGEAWNKLAKYNGNRVGENGRVRVGVRLKVPPAEALGLSEVKVASKVASKSADKALAKTEPKTTQVANLSEKAATSEAKDKSGLVVKSAKDAKQVVAQKAEKQASTKTRSYTVRKGDTLGAIAQHELGTVKRMYEILSLNKGTLKDAASLKAGMTIALPAK